MSALNTATLFGNDVDQKMVRLATMNLTLRGLANVRILLRNVLPNTQDNERKAELGLPAEGYHVVLANPPFSGRLDKDRIVDEVRVGTSTSTELLFLKYMMNSLRPGGRCGVIVPEGVLFGSTTAHKELRRQLLDTFKHRDERWTTWQTAFPPRPQGKGRGEGGVTKTEWTEKYWFTKAATLRANDFNLSAGRYRPMSQAAAVHRDPRELSF